MQIDLLIGWLCGTPTLSGVLYYWMTSKPGPGAWGRAKPSTYIIPPEIAGRESRRLSILRAPLINLFKKGFAMPLTKDDWTNVSNTLFFGFLNTVDLMVDGYKISLQLHSARNPLSRKIVGYVNDRLKLRWIHENSEVSEDIRNRFFFPLSRHFLSLARLKKIGYRGKKLSGYYNSAENKYVVRTPCWTSFNSLKRHLLANNKSIELYVEPASSKSESA